MHQIPTIEDEKTLTFDEAYRRAERRGEQRGELRGRVEGRVEGLLRMADALLEAHQLAALKRITDPDQLEQRLLAMLNAR